MADLKTKIGALELENPVIVASGTYGSGKEYSRLVEIGALGAVCTKTVTLKKVEGNKPPRIWETPSGMLNSIGLQNEGIESFLSDDLPFLVGKGVPVIVSIAGATIDECARLAKIVSAVPEINAIELNISCPNVKAGGAAFGSDPKAAADVVAKARLAGNKPLIVKLTPNVGDIKAIAKACERAGADALSLINTVQGMAVDIKTFKPRLGSIVGGLSGPAIRPIAVRMVWEVAKTVSVPVIGIGGIMSADDALEFIIAGAVAVGIGTANFINPRAPHEVIEGIDNFLTARGIRSVAEIVGSLRFD